MQRREIANVQNVVRANSMPADMNQTQQDTTSQAQANSLIATNNPRTSNDVNEALEEEKK